MTPQTATNHIEIQKLAKARGGGKTFQVITNFYDHFRNFMRKHVLPKM